MTEADLTDCRTTVFGVLDKYDGKLAARLYKESDFVDDDGSFHEGEWVVETRPNGTARHCLVGIGDCFRSPAWREMYQRVVEQMVADHESP